MTESAFLKLVRASAAYDLLLTAPFATPWTFALAHAHLSAVNAMLGAAALPAFGPFHMLFAGLMGSVVLVWSALRLRAPSIALGRHDAMARLSFAAWMAWTLAQTGAPLLWLFLVPELAWGVAQALPVGIKPAPAAAAPRAHP